MIRNVLVAFNGAWVVSETIQAVQSIIYPEGILFVDKYFIATQI